jgi:2-polyprenyl-6-hydroxyphenyl methylase / 3-demethylubiquinone-9 3-methyltransferase
VVGCQLSGVSAGCRADIPTRDVAGNMAGTVSRAEIAQFNALATRWWDPRGPMRALHDMNPTRISWISQRIARAFPGQDRVRVLDVGCGAGLAAEALAARGFDVLGIDGAAETIRAADSHAAGRGLPLHYRVATAEALVAEGMRVPVVTALEVIEHVPDPAMFLSVLTTLLEPQGLLFVSTLNRTVRSFLAAKVGAEYLLRWLPVGTHEWRRFITPVELMAILHRSGLALFDITGLAPDALRGRWRLSRELSVNYLAAARRT